MKSKRNSLIVTDFLFHPLTIVMETRITFVANPLIPGELVLIKFAFAIWYRLNSSNEILLLKNSEQFYI